MAAYWRFNKLLTLIGVAIFSIFIVVCFELGLLSKAYEALDTSQVDRQKWDVFFNVTILVVVLSTVALGVLALSIRVALAKPAREVRALPFRSIQARMQEIHYGVETLAKGVQHAAADLSNLLALSAAIETARPQKDGFEVVSSEIAELAERSSGLGHEIRERAEQLQFAVEKAMAELEQVAERVGISEAEVLLQRNNDCKPRP